MRIHGIAYLFIGALIIGASYYMSNIDENSSLQKFTLFLWVSYVFIGIGVFKIIKDIIIREPKIAKENFAHNNHNQTANVSNRHQQESRGVKYCAGCGAVLRNFDRFCYKCGSRQFRK